MSCSAEQIAEKKRLALERLKANQNRVPVQIAPQQPAAEQSKAQLIADNKRLALERLRAKQNTKSNPPPSTTANSASTFLSSNTFYSAESDLGKSKAPTQNRPKPYENPQTSSTQKTAQPQPAAIFQKTITSASCFLLTSSRFLVSSKSFFAPLIDTFKQIPSRSYGFYIKYSFNTTIRHYLSTSRHHLQAMDVSRRRIRPRPAATAVPQTGSRLQSASPVRTQPIEKRQTQSDRHGGRLMPGVARTATPKRSASVPAGRRSVWRPEARPLHDCRRDGTRENVPGPGTGGLLQTRLAAAHLHDGRNEVNECSIFIGFCF